MLIVETCAGLGNRLLSLASGYHWAKEIDDRYRVIWKIEDAMGADFEQIFMPIEGVEYVSVKDFGYKKHPFSQIKYNLTEKKYISRADYYSTIENTMQIYEDKGMEGFRQAMVSNDIKFIRALSEFYDLNKLDNPFSFIVPSKLVQDKVNRTVGDVDCSDVIGIHIRRADHVVCIENSPIELFINQIKKEIEINDKAKFYLASDDAPTIKQLSDMFGSRIMYMKEKDFSRNKPSGIVDAYAEMLCLSHSKKIIGSFYSSYSKMASMISGIPLEIMKID